MINISKHEICKLYSKKNKKKTVKYLRCVYLYHINLASHLTFDYCHR